MLPDTEQNLFLHQAAEQDKYHENKQYVTQPDKQVIIRSNILKE